MRDETAKRMGPTSLHPPAAGGEKETRDVVGLYEFGPFRLEPAERRLSRNGDAVVLTPKAFDTLHLLVRNHGHLVEKEEFLNKLWPDAFVEEGSLSNNVFLLRKALDDSTENPKYIETVQGRGYRFIAEIVANGTDSASPLTGVAMAPSLVVLSAPPTTAGGSTSRKLMAWLFAAGIICVGLAAFAYAKWRHRTELVPLNGVPITALPGWADFPAISPDGSRIVFEWTGEQQFAAFDLYVKIIGNENLLRLTNDPAVHLAPTWSPDGTQIAFQRVSKEGGGIYVVPANGGPVKKLRATNSSFDRSMRISWSLDGKTIAFADSPFPGGHKRLELLSLATLESKQIEHDEKCVEEVLPAFSPDGKQLAYACSLSGREGEFGLSVVTAEGRAPRMIRETSGWMKGLEWQGDGKALLFSENHTGVEHAVLRELNLANGSIRDRLVGLNSHFSDDFSAKAGRLAYTVNSGGHHIIWRGDLWHPNTPPEKLISTTRDQSCPQYSPDGKHVAFASNRGGPPEIWMSNADGQEIVQLTNLRGLATGSPTWSPDSRKIVFDSRTKTADGQIRPDLFIVDIDERMPWKLDTGTPGAFNPSWSHDGKWIYFVGGSDDAMGERIYRVPPEGGKPEVLTTARGYWPQESLDGQTLYFAANSGMNFTLHKASLKPTGTESPVNDMPTLSFLMNWEIVPGGVYFYPMEDLLTLSYFDFSTRKVRSIFKVSGGGSFLGGSVSPDGRYILYPELDDYQSDIMLVENFR
ncbi:MAG TPA: winged helix-turn-helix domain-containing protein [Chthoniobacterales bacterium]|jgi:Tol biopolymer transport system component/DNA-binding winged helix-turn-helix (wHTH) protein|nr:winged helix-turn-helix domain-containing protein [Chthoniobacterales bacterium]